jgi:hypothetical protein
MLSKPEKGELLYSGDHTALHINEANDWGADLFIALNLNASQDEYDTGAGMAVYKLTPEIQAAAEKVLDMLSGKTHLQNRGMEHRKDAVPLKRAGMPAGILDLGFITNKKDYDYITEHPDIISILVAKGIAEAFKSKLERPAMADIRKPAADIKPPLDLRPSADRLPPDYQMPAKDRMPPDYQMPAKDRMPPDCPKPSTDRMTPDCPKPSTDRMPQDCRNPEANTKPSDNPMFAASTKPAFYQLYPAGRKDVCRLVVSVFTSVQPRKPVANAHVTVYHGRDGKHMLIHQGTTSQTGTTMPIELPVYNDKNSGEPEMYCICVRHPEYMPKNKWITVRDERSMQEMIVLDDRKIKNR